ncbi:hypothetical protein LINGRAHAP2_LOCUS23832 [Linum grandiflorum]
MVMIEVSKPLPHEFRAHEDDEREWVSYKYERLPSAFYYSCGRLGHNNTSCNYKTELVADRYGDHTRAGPNSLAAPTSNKLMISNSLDSPVVERG